MTSWTSPRPSAMTLPISVVTVRARSSFFRRKIRAASRSSSPRRGAGVFRHFSNAAFAEWTASPISSTVAFGKVARTSPVAGLRVSKRFPSDFRHLPAMKRPYSWTMTHPRSQKAGLGYDPIVGTARVLEDAPPRDDTRRPSKVRGDEVGRPGTDLRREPLAPRRRSDPGRPAPERPARLHVERLVADHPGHARSHAEVPRGGEEHPGPRLAARAVREDLVRTIVDLRNPHAFLLQCGEHRRVNPIELPLGQEFPARRVLVRHDREAPAGVLQEPHAIDRSREEFELIGAADVPGPSAGDHAVPIEEHGRTVHRPRPVRQAVSVHTERAPRVRGLKEEIEEPPLREWVPGQRERLVDREPRGVFNLVGFEVKLF